MFGEEEMNRISVIEPGETCTDCKVSNHIDKFGAIIDPVKDKSCCSNMTPFVLMIALCVHATFEGLALGLQLQMNSALSIMLAIFIHKGAAGSALGISLVKAFPDNFRLVRQLITIFSLATPFGIVIGIIFSGSSEIVDVIFSSLAAGTFVYIACTEVVVSEFSIPGNRWLKLSMFVLGACIITSLWFIPGS